MFNEVLCRYNILFCGPLSENKRLIMRIQTSLCLLYCEPVEEKGHMDFKGTMQNKQLLHQNPLG